VLIPLQVENSSKKRKVRLQLATLKAVSESGELPNAGELSDAVSESRELPDASPITFPKNLPDDFKLLSLADKMAEKAMKRRPLSPAGSLEEFDDTPEQILKPPLAIGE